MDVVQARKDKDAETTWTGKDIEVNASVPDREDPEPPVHGVQVPAPLDVLVVERVPHLKEPHK